MDEVAVFNYALTPTQLLNLYFNAASGAPRVTALAASPSNTVFAGTTMTMSASVLGLAPFQYQWQTNGVNLPGATSAILLLTNVQVSNSGSYDVLVGNSDGTNESSPLVLKVNPWRAPGFTQEPAPSSVTNYVNGLATFAAIVTGSPPMAVQWEHNGTNLPGQTAACPDSAQSANERSRVHYTSAGFQRAFGHQPERARDVDGIAVAEWSVPECPDLPQR